MLHNPGRCERCKDALLHCDRYIEGGTCADRDGDACNPHTCGFRAKPVNEHELECTPEEYLAECKRRNNV